MQAIGLLVLAFVSLAAALLMDCMGGIFWVFLALCFFSYYVSKDVSNSLTGVVANIERKCVMFHHGLSESDSSSDWRLN
ncbi:MAG: hypothetical protein MUW57_28340 [Pseudomonas sp.]|nr:hypothetical protein [Pseudomonas sp.]